MMNNGTRLGSTVDSVDSVDPVVLTCRDTNYIVHAIGLICYVVDSISLISY